MSFPASCIDNCRKSNSCSKIQSSTIVLAFVPRSFGFMLNSRVILNLHKLGNISEMEECLNDLSTFTTVLQFIKIIS